MDYPSSQPSDQRSNQTIHCNQLFDEHFDQSVKHSVNQYFIALQSPIQFDQQSTTVNNSTVQPDQPSNHPTNTLLHSIQQSTAIGTSNHHFQSDCDGLYGFRAIGRLVNQRSINHLDQLPTLNNPPLERSPSIIHLDYPYSHQPPLRTSTSASLTVAGFGFRKIGRLANQPSIKHLFRISSTQIRQQSNSNDHNHSDRGEI